MIYVKHKEHGNKHIEGAVLDEHIAAGWVKWPRSKAEKAGLPPVAPEPPEEVEQPVKRAYVRKAK